VSRRASLLLGLLLAAPSAARADEAAAGAVEEKLNDGSISAPEPEATPPPGQEAPPPVALETTVQGYLDTRQTYTHLAGGRLFPARETPAWSSITEGNVQLRLRWGDQGTAYVDASFFHQAGRFFQADTADGGLEPFDDHDVPALRPAAIISEAYATKNFGDHARLTLGKKRIVWGPGFAQNPTDLLNPPKDPTDPTFQRAGSWLGWLEFPFETFTLSFVGAAKTLRQYGGLPSALLYYPDHPTAEAVKDPSLDDRDTDPHFSAAARAYFLWRDTDVNLFWFFGNRYNDAFEHKHRAGFSLSRVFGEWEVHVEALGQFGSPRVYASAECVASVSALGACAMAGKSVAARDRLTSDAFTPRVLAGARWTLEDNGLLSLEYYYLGDGYTQDEFRDYVSLLHYGQKALAALPAGAPRPSLPGQQASDPGSPQKFTFDPLRRHYLFVTWQQPQVRDDFTLSATLLLNLQDLSGQLVPGVTWSVREWLNLSTAVFVALPGPSALGVDVDGRNYTEYGLFNSDWRAFVSARAFF
jgi:hypothetical protein